MRYPWWMGRSALYRDPAPFQSPRAALQLDGEELFVVEHGRLRRHPLDGYAASVHDGSCVVRIDEPGYAGRGSAAGWQRGSAAEWRPERRFVRMLLLERERERLAIITPPEHGAVAPNVVRLPEAPGDAVIVEIGV